MDKESGLLSSPLLDLSQQLQANSGTCIVKCLDYPFQFFLLCKIALPYPHKCLVGFVEQNTSTDKNF